MAAKWTSAPLVLVLLGFVAEAGPVKVTVRDEKPVVVEATLPVEPGLRIKYSPGGLVAQIQSENNGTLHLSHFPAFHINGQVFQPTNNPMGGRFEKQNQPLAKTPGGRDRHGFTSVYQHGDLWITYTAEVIPSKAAKSADKRRLDAVLMRYSVENKGAQPAKFGLRIYMDTYVISNDGCLFAAPNRPGKVLDGMELGGKALPDYVQLLERPQLDNPGFVAHLTLALGSKFDTPNRVVLTRHGAGFGGWDMPAMQAGGDSALGVFWEPKDIPPGGKRELAYAYGQGVAVPPDHEGRFEVQLGGNFEPGKLFTVSAVVHDPVPGQALTLELPAGMQKVEGREVQPVPPPTDDVPRSMVLWKARVTQHGEFPLRVRSTTGVTQTKTIKVEPAE